jgi:hypothetical protein
LDLFRKLRSCALCPFYSCFVLEVEDALPSESEELFDISNICLSPKLEAVPLNTFPSIAGPYKLEADIQELEPISFDNEGIFQTFGFVES